MVNLQAPPQQVVPLGANICFMVALVLTTASSAMTLEQLTPVCIAGNPAGICLWVRGMGIDWCSVCFGHFHCGVPSQLKQKLSKDMGQSLEIYMISWCT